MTAAAALGRIGGDVATEELTSQTWDVVVVGGGHNGLTAAAYLAKAGKRVVVMERRDRVGGACTIEEPWPGYRVSPCAYVVGLLHERVVEDLNLGRRGYRVTMFDPQLYVPLEDGSVFVEWRDADRTAADLATWAPAEVKGWRAMIDLQGRIKEALRPAGDDDLWLRTDPPSREEVESRLGGDPVAIATVFEDSIETMLGRFFDDQRLVDAISGQGIIGTAASPKEQGTAWIHMHHSLGRVDEGIGGWGLVHGGMGVTSFALADAALEAGALIATGTPVEAIEPGRGVRLSDGPLVRARAILSNADPATTLTLLADQPEGFRTQVESTPRLGTSAKVNYALSGLPEFQHPFGAMATVNVGASVAGLHASAGAARRGDLPDHVWGELYIQSPYDSSIVPEGKQIMSCFAQYLPYEFSEGDWDTRRKEVEARITAQIERYAPGFTSLIEAVEVSGPPDIERRIGLKGGHIFHGECLPDYMWDKRIPYRTPIRGLYLCGAGTHPGGSVIAVNGRNAALCVLDDLSA